MIIADENIDRNVILALRKANHKITSIAENYPGISDEDVINLTITLEGILLTCDKDIGEWVFAHGRKGFSVLFLRYEKEETTEIIKNIILILEKLTADEHVFISITKNKIRQRRI
jgi:predicted nuclease of predicted toxin-antitoxin system